MGFLHGNGHKDIKEHMKVSQLDFEYMLECQERDIATILVEEQCMSIHKALDILYTSKTYSLLHNPATGLYFQSPRYVYSLLKEEMSGNENTEECDRT